MKDGKKTTIAQGILWNSCGSIVYLFAQWLLTVLVMRLQGYEDAGIFSLAMSATNILYAVAVYGMRNYQVSDVDRRYSAGEYQKSRLITGAFALTLFALFLGFAGYSQRQTLCMAVYGLFRIGEAACDVFAGEYQLRGRMDCLGISQLLRAAVMLTVFTLTLYLTQALAAAIMAMTLAVFMAICLYDVPRIRRPEKAEPPRGSRGVWSLLAVCAPLAVCSLLTNSIASVPRFFLERYLGSAELGIYAAIAAPTLIVQAAASYVFVPMLTVFADAHAAGDKKTFQRALGRCLALVGLMAAVSLPGGKLLGAWGLRLLYGASRSNIAEYTFLLLPLIVCTLLTALLWLVNGVLTVLRDFRVLIAGNGLAVALSIAGSVLLIPRFGLQGGSLALIAALFVSVLLLLLRLLHKSRRIGE